MSTPAIIEKEFGNLNPLDDSLYRLDEEELTFMKTQSGIEDEEELKKHVLAVQAEAYKVNSFPSGFLDNPDRGASQSSDSSLSVHSELWLPAVSISSNHRAQLSGDVIDASVTNTVTAQVQDCAVAGIHATFGSGKRATRPYIPRHRMLL